MQKNTNNLNRPEPKYIKYIFIFLQVCDDCPKTFGAERSLRIHTLQVHQTELICDKCAKNFGTDHKKFLRHLQRAHITEVISRDFSITFFLVTVFPHIVSAETILF